MYAKLESGISDNQLGFRWNIRNNAADMSIMTDKKAFNRIQRKMLTDILQNSEIDDENVIIDYKKNRYQT